MANFGKSIQKFLIILLVFGVIVAALAFLLNGDNWGYVFSKTVKGEILEVERVTQATAIIGSGRPIPNEQLFSFAVAIRGIDGEIFTASTEDRQWAVARKGFCVEAEFYPYPPWDLQKRGTYRNARLTRLMDCKPGVTSPLNSAAAAPPVVAPAATPAELAPPPQQQMPSASPTP